MTNLLLYMEDDYCVVVTHNLEKDQEDLSRILLGVKALRFESPMYVPSASWKYECINIKIRVFYKMIPDIEFLQTRTDNLFEVMPDRVREFLKMVDKKNNRR